jgi:translation elongation factor EF-1alpha
MAKLQIKDVSTVMNSTIVTGFLRDGELKVGMRVKVDDRTLEIKTIEVKHEPKEKAVAGDVVNISVRFFSNIFGEGVASGKPNPEYDLLKGMKKAILEFS